MCEITRSKTFGIPPKTCIWKQFAVKHSGLRIADRDNSIHKGVRTCIVPAQVSAVWIRLPRNLCKESRKGLTEGLREYFKIDNKRALEVGYLKRGMGTFTVRKPKVTEGCREVNGQGKVGPIDVES